MISEWANKFNIKIVPCEQRPDKPSGEIVYRIKDLFTTRNGSWEPSNDYGSLPQWARDAYLKPSGAPDYFDDAGADHSLFALVLGLDGKPVKTEILVRFWSDGFDKLGDPGYAGYVRSTPKPGSGWAKNDIWNNFKPEAGQQGAWCWCPDGAADVALGGGMPNNHHVSTFVVWQAERRNDDDHRPPRSEFTVTPQVIGVNEVAQLQWKVSAARTVTLEGPLPSGQGSLSIAPAVTSSFTLRVVHDDASTEELQATVTVQDKRRRPPTVVLTPENIAHLRTFPRPPKDNGIGLHFHLDLPDPRESSLIAETIEHLKYIRATWTLIYAQDAEQAERAARPCWQAGIMPVVRIGAKIDGSPVFPEPYVQMLKAIGAPPYVQIYNEPEDPREYKDYGMPPDWAEIFGRRWASVAAETIKCGGYAGLQVLSREAFDAAVDAVPGQGQADLWKHAFFVQHNYAENHPPVYPYDERNQKDNPGQTILDDTLGTLSFLAYAAWMRERLDFVLPIIGGEGGWLYGADKDQRYPKVEGPLHAQYNKEMFEWLRTGALSNGEPTPDYLFSITPWIAGSFNFGAQNWWGNWIRSDGKLTETIEAVRGISEFEHTFSWG